MGTRGQGVGGGFAQWNCRGMKDKIPELKGWLVKFKPDIMILNESHFTEEAKSPFKNYFMYGIVGIGKWGMHVLIRQGIAHHILHRTETDVGAEGIILQATIKRERITVVGGYWPPTYEPIAEEWINFTKLESGPYV